MFRHTITLLLIFLVANHEYATARSVEFIPSPLSRIQKRNAVEENVEGEETAVSEVHSRQKRRSWAALRTGIAVVSGASFVLSTASTIYHAIRKCKDYKPTSCKSAKCDYHSCPDPCRGPQSNRDYVEEERSDIKNKLKIMDQTQLDAFNLATKAISAAINNKRIMAEIDRINNKVDELIFSIAQMDINLGAKFRNKSVAIKTLLRNHLLSLDEIVSSQEVQGLFDKWTWEGTGLFVLSIALPLSLTAFNYFRQRHAINQIYKNLKIDFSQRFVNQKASTLNPNAKLHNKFAPVQGLSTKQIDKQLKAMSKAIYLSDRANAHVSKVEKITNNYITPIVNVIVTALSAWTVYTQISNCIAIANDMQDTAILMSEKADEIEKFKQKDVDPLLANVKTQVWPKVKNLVTNETTTDWLDGIKNLTLEASTFNRTVPVVIQRFIDQAPTAGYDKFISLQLELITALKAIEYEYECLADKQHAITTVIKDCRLGREPFPALYQYATQKHKLNRQGCIAKGIIPYTSQEQFFTILNATAVHQDWYTNCLLNSESLIYRVCDEKVKGYTKPSQIVKQVNNTGLTEDMVTNILGRCPPPKITPKSINITCDLYCLYQPEDKISKTAVLLVSQVRQVIKTCPICKVKDSDLTLICRYSKCQGLNATEIEKKVEIPLPTVEYMIKNRCSGCVITDPEEKKKICVSHSCRGHSNAKIAKAHGLVESAIIGIVNECSTIVPSCVAVLTTKEKKRIFDLDCYNVPHSAIPFIVEFSSTVVQDLLKLTKGKPCYPYPGSPTSRG